MEKNNEILAMLIGSANFSSKGLRTDLRESLAQANRGSFSMMNSYLTLIENNTIHDPIILNPTSALNQQMLAQSLTNDLSHDIPLFDPKTNTVPKSSGLNWGKSKGHVAPGDAEIRIRSTIINENPGLISPFDSTYVHAKKGRARNSDPVELIWDDGTIMPASFEGEGTKVEGIVYPKQITSYSSTRQLLSDGTRISAKSILGRYLRKRLGVDLDHLITIADLNNYGRNTITLSLIEDGLYYCDFSI
ncbi:TPA: NgoFVII family restriction endonuclease [Listeria monocytogenes]|nr:NgoFVII family restriction endonuclease [Listeria monocytogenes]HDM9928138.1 NgoFVII family restriction endonuclease [Listeria monocytogenes]